MSVPYFRRIILAAAASGLAFVVYGHFFSKPRVLAVNEVPIAFWAWQNQAPDAADVQKAFHATSAKTLFLRAGQLDLENGAVKRIRPVSGTLPANTSIHLVYNGTRKLLHEWERLEPETIAHAIAETYHGDLARSGNDHATVDGIQLDLDVPTRLLPAYAQVLQKLRLLLPPETKLSITGLPTWAETREIKLVLANVDFWIPQCYGTSIPTNVSERIPISSAENVARMIAKFRELDKPFYAGLSAYSYAILYAKDGSLVDLRGDIDPALATHNAGLELIDTQTFKGDTQASETRYVYRAKTDVVLDGLIIRPDETLVFDLPNAASLRSAARAVRENAGERLIGICVFRLPTADDAATLSVGEIAAALTDTQTRIATTLTLEATSDSRLKLSAENIGSASTILADDALTVDLSVPPGSVDGASSFEDFTTYETLCGLIGSENPRPCSPLRANILRLKARSWTPDSRASVLLSTNQPFPARLRALMTTRVNDGRIDRQAIDLKIQNSEN